MCTMHTARQELWCSSVPCGWGRGWGSLPHWYRGCSVQHHAHKMHLYNSCGVVDVSHGVEDRAKANAVLTCTFTVRMYGKETTAGNSADM